MNRRPLGNSKKKNEFKECHQARSNALSSGMSQCEIKHWACADSRNKLDAQQRRFYFEYFQVHTASMTTGRHSTRASKARTKRTFGATFPPVYSSNVNQKDRQVIALPTLDIPVFVDTVRQDSSQHDNGHSRSDTKEEREERRSI